MLDVFCHTGAFGLRAAAAGAEAVMLVDSSQPALDHALSAATANGLHSRVSARRGDAFDTMGALAAANERFDIVVEMKNERGVGPGRAQIDEAGIVEC